MLDRPQRCIREHDQLNKNEENSTVALPCENESKWALRSCTLSDQASAHAFSWKRRRNSERKHKAASRNKPLHTTLDSPHTPAQFVGNAHLHPSGAKLPSHSSFVVQRLSFHPRYLTRRLTSLDLLRPESLEIRRHSPQLGNILRTLQSLCLQYGRGAFCHIFRPRLGSDPSIATGLTPRLENAQPTAVLVRVDRILCRACCCCFCVQAFGQDGRSCRVAPGKADDHRPRFGFLFIDSTHTSFGIATSDNGRALLILTHLPSLRPALSVPPHATEQADVNDQAAETNFDSRATTLSASQFEARFLRPVTCFARFATRTLRHSSLSRYWVPHHTPRWCISVSLSSAIGFGFPSSLSARNTAHVALASLFSPFLAQRSSRQHISAPLHLRPPQRAYRHL